MYRHVISKFEADDIPLYMFLHVWRRKASCKKTQGELDAKRAGSTYSSLPLSLGLWFSYELYCETETAETLII